VINQREGYHEKWDMPKEVTMKPFFEHYPQLKKYPFPDDKTFSWFWYYGMQQMGDDQAKESRMAVEKKLIARQHFTNMAALFIPTIQTQLGINEMAGSDLDSHLDFQQAVRQYHEQIRLRFYPGIFQEKPISSTAVEKIPLKRFEAKKSYPYERLLSIILATVILLAISIRNLSNKRLAKWSF
jgi:ABC-2 type transport system permease protein